MFVVLLALVWAMVLLPSVLRTRLESSPMDGVRSFEKSMGILASARNRKSSPPGRWIMVPRHVTVPVRRRSRVVRRRRANFERLAVLAILTFAIGIAPALRWMWFVHLAVDAALGLYVSRLLKWKRDEQERLRIVAPLPTEHPVEAERQSG